MIRVELDVDTLLLLALLLVLLAHPCGNAPRRAARHRSGQRGGENVTPMPRAAVH